MIVPRETENNGYANFFGGGGVGGTKKIIMVELDTFEGGLISGVESCFNTL